MSVAKRYLDPKNDIVFKRIFGEHPEILRSFLNALLPLPEDAKIVSLEYLPAEQVPHLPLLKNSLVDVRCKDQLGRQFIVEMQMNWTNAFLQRVLFNASKAYVRQLERGERYEHLQPVIGLSVLDAIFRPETETFYHHYQLAEEGRPEEIIEGLQLVFIELPKFKPDLLAEPLRNAWLRFLQETGDAETPEEVRSLETDLSAQSAEIREAVQLSAEAAFTPMELDAYDRYWDIVRTERTLFAGKSREAMAEGLAAGLEKGHQEGLAKGHQEGLAKGREEGREEGVAIGRADERAILYQKLLSSGMTPAEAHQFIE
jgi:predicted transposase/invertase (TIGR01784 family)